MSYFIRHPGRYSLIGFILLFATMAVAQEHKTQTRIKFTTRFEKSDYIQVFYSNTPSKFEEKYQAKAKINGAGFVTTEVEIAAISLYPYLRIDFGSKPENTIEVKQIEFVYNKHSFVLKPSDIATSFHPNKYLIIVGVNDSTVIFKTRELENKCDPYMVLPFEKINLLKYSLGVIDTVYLSKFNLSFGSTTKNIITLFYYDFHDTNSPDFKYSNSARVFSDTLNIYTPAPIKYFQIAFFDKKEQTTISVQQIYFSSFNYLLNVKGRNIPKKFDLLNINSPPIIKDNEVIFKIENSPVVLRVKNKIESWQTKMKRFVINLGILAFSAIILIIANKTFLNLKTGI